MVVSAPRGIGAVLGRITLLLLQIACRSGGVYCGSLRLGPEILAKMANYDMIHALVLGFCFMKIKIENME